MLHNFIYICWHVITHWADSTDSSEAQNIAFKITFKKSFKLWQMSNVFILFIYGFIYGFILFMAMCLWGFKFCFFLLTQPTEMTTFKLHASMKILKHVTQTAGEEMSLKVSLCREFNVWVYVIWLTCPFF